MKVTTIIKWYTLICWFILLAMLCSCRQIGKGTVVDKQYTPGWYEHRSKSVYYHFPKYEIRVEGQTKNWETVREWWRVSSGNYDRIKLGDKVDSTVIKLF